MRFEHENIRWIYYLAVIQGVSKKAEKNLYKIKSSITSPAFDLTGLLQHGISLIFQKISNKPFHKLLQEHHLPRFETITKVIISLETSNRTFMKRVHL